MMFGEHFGVCSKKMVEIYERREQRTDSQRLTVNELMEKVRDMYWGVEESGSRE